MATTVGRNICLDRRQWRTRIGQVLGFSTVDNMTPRPFPTSRTNAPHTTHMQVQNIHRNRPMDEVRHSNVSQPPLPRDHPTHHHYQQHAAPLAAPARR